MSLRRQRSRQLVKGHRGVLERSVLVLLAVMADVIVHGVRKRCREKGAPKYME